MKDMKITRAFLLTVLVAGIIFAGERTVDDPIKLYTMNCGTLDVSDMNDLSSDGRYAGQETTLVNPCFLIRHPKGDLLWDTGLEDKLAETPDGEKAGVWHSKMEAKLVAQLGELGLKPLDIEFLSLSHLHPDHSGNANQFATATFIVNHHERDYMFSKELKEAFGSVYSELEGAETIVFEKEHDVFGDGRVVIQGMPGHTPGSSVLLIRLEKSGNVLLTGDLYVHARGRELKTIPSFNTDKQSTLDSRRRFEDLALKEKARVIIQHEKRDFEELPQFPQFLE